MIHYTIAGVDPGPIPGLAVIEFWRSADGLEYHPNRVRALQCSPNWLDSLLTELLWAAVGNDFPAILAVEKYVPRRGAGRQLAAGANQKTQEMAARIVGKYAELAKRETAWGRLTVVNYEPSGVLHWANEQKLRKAGLWDPTTGCAHARAAAKHALYAAVRHAGMPNPLSPRNGDTLTLR